MIANVTIAIQAGGRSSRMGRDKGLVLLAGKPLVAHVMTRVEGLADDLLLTTNTPEPYAEFGLRMASDALPGAGALPGLWTALEAARGEFVLVVACDMPFLNRDLLAYQLEMAAQMDVVVPRWEGHYQTMHAVYRRSTCLAAVEAALASGEKRMISFYDAVDVLEINAETVQQFDPDGRTFFNVNTPDDLAEAELLLAAQG
jgi:molybdopterin-guanine dinucleotide biosynthesis protein A